MEVMVVDCMYTQVPRADSDCLADLMTLRSQRAGSVSAFAGLGIVEIGAFSTASPRGPSSPMPGGSTCSRLPCRGHLPSSQLHQAL